MIWVIGLDIFDYKWEGWEQITFSLPIQTHDYRAFTLINNGLRGLSANQLSGQSYKRSTIINCCPDQMDDDTFLNIPKLLALYTNRKMSSKKVFHFSKLDRQGKAFCWITNALGPFESHQSRRSWGRRATPRSGANADSAAPDVSPNLADVQRFPLVQKTIKLPPLLR